MSQPHPTSLTHQSRHANHNLTAKETADLTKRCNCAAKSSSTLQLVARPHVSGLFHRNLIRHAHYDNEPRTRLYPQTPRVKRESFATPSGKAFAATSRTPVLRSTLQRSNPPKPKHKNSCPPWFFRGLRSKCNCCSLSSARQVH